jgi:hypothetical protein
LSVIKEGVGIPAKKNRELGQRKDELIDQQKQTGRRFKKTGKGCRKNELK